MESRVLGPVILPKRRGWWLTGAGIVICLAVVYGLWFLPVLTSWPTGIFDHTVARQLEREAKIQAPITPGPSVGDTTLVRDTAAPNVYYPLYILSHLPNNTDGTVVHGVLQSSQFYQVKHWLAVAALRTPGQWSWWSTAMGTPVTQLADARQDVTTVAQALHFFESNNSDAGQMYSVTTSDALQGAAAVAISTVAIPTVLLNSMNHGKGPAVPSVCHALHAASAETACNSLTVLWVRPRKGVTIRAY